MAKEGSLYARKQANLSYTLTRKSEKVSTSCVSLWRHLRNDWEGGEVEYCCSQGTENSNLSWIYLSFNTLLFLRVFRRADFFPNLQDFIL